MISTILFQFIHDGFNLMINLQFLLLKQRIHPLKQPIMQLSFQMFPNHLILNIMFLPEPQHGNDLGCAHLLLVIQQLITRSLEVIIIENMNITIIHIQIMHNFLI